MTRTLLLLATLALAATACSRAAETWPPAPPSIRLGEDACANCRMIVSDGRFASHARRRAAPDVELVFDDFGCLLAADKTSPFEPQGVFVRRFDGDAWLRGDAAFVVRAKDIASPMGSGCAAFASREAAEKEAARHAGAAVSELAGLLSGAAK